MGGRGHVLESLLFLTTQPQVSPPPPKTVVLFALSGEGQAGFTKAGFSAINWVSPEGLEITFGV